MQDIDTILERIRLNSAAHSTNHKKRYITLKTRLKWYRLPVIILSALNSIFSIGLQPFMKQEIISVLNSLIALICGIIGSIELYLQLNRQMEQTLSSSKDFYELATDIFKWLALKPEHRPIDAKTFIDDSYNRYIKLTQSSILLKKRMDDQLTSYKLIELEPLELAALGEPSPSSSSLTSDESV
jgi:hypothetical protein